MSSTPSGQLLVVTDETLGGVPEAESVAQREGARLQVLRVAGDRDAIVEALRGASVALVQYAELDAEALAGMRDAKVVIRYGIGVDNVDTRAAALSGVRVANVPDYGTDVVADHATALLLSAMRRLFQYQFLVRRDGWVDADSVGPVPAVADSCIGLIGAGRIALAVAQRMRAFGCRIVAADPFADAEDLARHDIELLEPEQVFATADAVSLHAPLTPETAGIVNADTLALMRPHCVLVNTARGPLVDTAALVEALSSGALAAAALDVVDGEPLTADHPLLRLQNALVVPHVGFYSERSLRLLERLAAEEAGRALRGEPLRCEVRPPEADGV